MPTPSRTCSTTRVWRRSTASGPSAVVGSSRSSTFGRVSSAFATSRSCRSASGSEPVSAVTAMSSLNAARRLFRPALHPPPGRPRVGGHREKEVLGDRQLENVRVVLVGDAEAEAPRRRGRVVCKALPADLDGSPVRREEAAGDSEQCRFPGPVLPDESVDLTRMAVDADVAEGLHRSERLRQPASGQHVGCHGPGIRHFRSQFLVLDPPTDTSCGEG